MQFVSEHRLLSGASIHQGKSNLLLLRMEAAAMGCSIGLFLVSLVFLFL
jgi:hypothetical protein